MLGLYKGESVMNARISVPMDMWGPGPARGSRTMRQGIWLAENKMNGPFSLVRVCAK